LSIVKEINDDVFFGKSTTAEFVVALDSASGGYAFSGCNWCSHYQGAEKEIRRNNFQSRVCFATSSLRVVLNCANCPSVASSTMGNTVTTNLDINYLFVDPLPPEKTNHTFTFQVRTPHPSRDDVVTFGIVAIPDENGKSTGRLFRSLDDAEWNKIRARKDDNVTHFDHAFNSHLRDFEVLHPFTPNEIRVARWAGIGVIILECARLQINMFFEGTQESPQVQLEFFTWNHSDEAKGALSADLGLGYDVMFIANDSDIHSLCESVDERDTGPTAIFAPGLDQSLGKKRKKPKL